MRAAFATESSADAQRSFAAEESHRHAFIVYQASDAGLGRGDLMYGLLTRNVFWQPQQPCLQKFRSRRPGFEPRRSAESTNP